MVLCAAGLLFPPFEEAWFFLLAAIPFTTVGALIAYERPDLSVGWLMLGFGIVASLSFLCTQYFLRGAITEPGSLPGTDLALSLAVHTWHPGFSLFILAFLLFPDGKLLSPRWRIAAWVTAALGVTGVIFGMFEYQFQRDWSPRYEAGSSPLFNDPLRSIGDVVFGLCVLALVVMFLVSAVSIFIRLHRSKGVMRQQMKWVAFAIILAPLALVGSLLVVGNGGLGVVVFPLIPISMAIAILRHRLFDIDRLIRRTIVYAGLTASLAALYFVAVVLGFEIVSGGGESAPPLVVAATTLVLAALFRPVRARILRDGFLTFIDWSDIRLLTYEFWLTSAAMDRNRMEG
ncbi:hypothetical protein BH20ACT23_BH20ACT23_19900 [soil metagenome]